MELHDDDKPIGRVLSRREVMKLLGGAGIALIGGAGWTKLVFAQDATAEATAAVASCVVKPAETEGPYFVDEMLKRFDVRVDPTDGSIKDGIPLHLKFQVLQIDSDTCTPLPGAQVDIGTVTRSAPTPTPTIPVSTLLDKNGCVVIRSPTTTARSISSPFIPVGIQAALCIFTSKSALIRPPKPAMNSPHSFSLMMPSVLHYLLKHPIPPIPKARHPIPPTVPMAFMMPNCC